MFCLLGEPFDDTLMSPHWGMGVRCVHSYQGCPGWVRHSAASVFLPDPCVAVAEPHVSTEAYACGHQWPDAARSRAG